MWKQLPSYSTNWRENKGGRHLRSRLFQTARPPDAQIFLAFCLLQLRNKCRSHSPLQSLLLNYRSALAELIRVLKYAKVS